MKPFQLFGVAAALALTATTIQAELQLGSTKKEVIAELGKPDMQTQHKGRLIFYYAGRAVEFEDGQVVSFEDDLFDQIDKREEEKAYEQRQRDKGLVKYGDQWMTPTQAFDLKVKKAEAKKVRQLRKVFAKGHKRNKSPRKHTYGESVSVINNGGKKVNLSKVKKKGKITIVDFYADWCGPCRKISPHLEQIANNNPDVKLVKINIVNWQTPVVKQFGLTSIPHIRVYNKKGKQIGPATSNAKQVLDSVEKAS